jgi:hypothetical protein
MNVYSLLAGQFFVFLAFCPFKSYFSFFMPNLGELFWIVIISLIAQGPILLVNIIQNFFFPDQIDKIINQSKIAK